MGRGREGTPGLNSEDPYVQCQVEEKDPANRLRRRGQRGRRMIQERGMRWMPRKKSCFKREAARLLEMLLSSQMTRGQGMVFGAGHTGVIVTVTEVGQWYSGGRSQIIGD